MSEDKVRRVLQAYADLVPAERDGDASSATDDVVPLPFAPSSGTPLGLSEFFSPRTFTLTAPVSYLRETPDLARLARIDALHRDERLLRLGWVFITGTIEIDGRRRKVLHPLLTRPVSLRVNKIAARAMSVLNDLEAHADLTLHAEGDPELTRRITDPATREHCVASAQFGGGSLELNTPTESLLRRLPRLRSWIHSTAEAAGLPVTKIVLADDLSTPPDDRDGLHAVVTYGLVLLRDVEVPNVRNSLLDWSSRAVGRTAFAALIDPGDADGEPVEPPPRVDSPLPLTPSQRAIVMAARSRATTTVSGAPGTGKTHTICAIAMDAIDRGQSVLVATKSRFAADVVSELLERTPGPDPVRFGDGTAMASVIDDLSDRLATGQPSQVLERSALEEARARTAVEVLLGEVSERLERQRRAADWSRWEPLVGQLGHDAPGLMESDIDLEVATTLLGTATAPGPGLFAGWRSRRAARRLRRLAMAAPDTDLTRLGSALDAAACRRAAAELATVGEGDVDDTWIRLERAEDDLRSAIGNRLATVSWGPNVSDEEGRRGLADLVNALRAGRSRRRTLLSEMAQGHLTATAPLWIGTLADIEDVLPAVPALFDIVVLDEASQIDQPLAAPALLRGARSVIVGDPHQLRHVSFRSDAEVDATLTAFELQDHRARLDIRRVSAFDLAATAAPVIPLREHFRSVPHLIGFSAARFYHEHLAVMTRTPATEALDAIDVVTVATSSGEGPGPAPDPEIASVLALVDEHEAAQRDGAGHSLGVITPFRAQADALEQALVDHLDPDRIERLGLRTGTVHAFQGGERDVVIISTGLDGAPAGRRRFIDQPDLFNVMVTRARRRNVVVTSADTPDGLLGDYVAYGEHGPPAPRCTHIDDTWTVALAEELVRAGLSLRLGYPVGDWVLDICIDEGAHPVALETRVSPAGTDDHVERRLCLSRLGWTVLDAFPSVWDGKAAEAALDLIERVRSAGTP